jgi:predicted nucleic acid-binding protein
MTQCNYAIAIQLRQSRKLTLGDALIAATCMEQGGTLATANVGDFSWIKELKVFNPLGVD